MWLRESSYEMVFQRTLGHVVFGAALWAAASSVAVARPAPAPSPSPPAATTAPTDREALADAWWTGPMLAPSAGTLPRGHLLVEPYVFDVMQYGSYDRAGVLQPVTHSNTYGSLTYIVYGLTDRVSVGLIPTFGINTVDGGPSSSGIRAGDLSLQAQYRLTQFREGGWMPTTSINVEETLPTGTYDRLGDNPSNGFGSGVHTTTVSLYAQTYFWMRSGRILRTRLNASDAFSGPVAISGVSVYGTGASFVGHANPSKAFTLDGAAEYSITRNWVFAFDFVYHHSGDTQLVGTSGVSDSGPSRAYEWAPAIEYNFTPNVGVLLGVRTIPAGRNAAASVTPAIAVNIVR